MNDRLLLQWIQDEIERCEALAPRSIIRLKPSADCRAAARELQTTFHGSPLSEAIIPLPLINGISCPIPLSAKTASFPQVAGLENDGQVAAVHGLPSRPSGKGFALGSRTISRSKPFVPWGIRHIQAPQVWKRSTGDKIRIGVIDTGIDYSHPDLQGSIGGGVNLIYPHKPPIDDNGHGTHISGTIAASAKHGMAGVAPYATIYAVKAFDHNGTSYVTDIVQGIEWCVRHRLHLINMSFGMKTRSAALEAAVRNASREGVIIVASSGNEGKKGFVDYPARFDNTIAVGATTRERKIAPFSNKGSSIDIYAPGDKITSTWLNGNYQELSGTSMATSHVTGVLALLMAAKPEASMKTLLSYLQAGAAPLSSNARKAGFLGEVNALRALKEAFKPSS